MARTLDLRRHPQGRRARLWREAALWLALGGLPAGLVLLAVLQALPDAAHWQARLQDHQSALERDRQARLAARAAQARQAEAVRHAQQWQVRAARQRWLDGLGQALLSMPGVQLQQLHLDTRQVRLQLWAPHEQALLQAQSRLQAAGTGPWWVAQQTAEAASAMVPPSAGAMPASTLPAQGWQFVLQAQLPAQPDVPATAEQAR